MGGGGGGGGGGVIGVSLSEPHIVMISGCPSGVCLVFV